MDLSVVIPVFNEARNVQPLIERLETVLASLGLTYEVLVVNDGSNDDTLARLIELRRTRAWLKIVDLRRNFGQHGATYAGFDHAVGEMVVTLDGDLQNDPADIPLLVEKSREGYDIVCGWRKDRKDALFSRRIPSLVVNHVIRRHSSFPIHDYGCFLRLYSNAAAKEISQYASSRSWFPVMFAKLGFRVAEVEVRHHARTGQDESKHSLLTRVNQFVSVLIGATDNPFLYVIIFGLAGTAVAAGLGLVALILLLFQRSMWGLLAAGVVSFLLSFLIVVTGVVGEYVARVHHETGRAPKYLVRKVIG